MTLFRTATRLLPCLPLLAAAAGAAEPTGTIEVAVQGVRSSQGLVMVQICPRAAFPGPCAWSGEAAAHAGTTMVQVRGVPPGGYAALAFHDANGNRRLDRLMGVPREGFGFSRLTRMPFSLPRFDEVRFDHGGADQRLPLTLRYLW